MTINATSVVERFVQPMLDHRAKLTTKAAAVEEVRQTLSTAGKHLDQYGETQQKLATAATAHWQGTAANGFTKQSSTLTSGLGKATTAVTEGSKIVTTAANAITGGHHQVQQLLDEYLAKAGTLLGGALKAHGAGRKSALLTGLASLGDLATKYNAESAKVLSKAHGEVDTATKQLTALEHRVHAGGVRDPKKPVHKKTAAHHAKKPAKHPAHHDAHHPAHHPAKATHHHADGGTHASSATKVHIGHGLGDVTAPNPKAAKAVRAALTQLGVPYVWGGATPGKGLDCSGLTQYAYKKAGISLVHYASSQRVGKHITSESDLKPGDLVVFSGHVTMYLGKGHVIAAPHTGTDVQIENLFTHISGDPFLGFYRPSVR